MTERPEGAPNEPPAESDVVPDTEIDAIEEELEAEEADVEEAESELEEAEERASEELDEPSAVLIDEQGAEGGVAAGAAAGAAVPRRRSAQPPSVQRAPTQSELAVRVTDNSSRIFVIATVAIFVAILGYGLVGGVGGFLTTTPAPSAAPSVSAAPSESVVPSLSATPSTEPIPSPS